MIETLVYKKKIKLEQLRKEIKIKTDMPSHGLEPRIDIDYKSIALPIEL